MWKGCPWKRQIFAVSFVFCFIELVMFSIYDVNSNEQMQLFHANTDIAVCNATDKNLNIKGKICEFFLFQCTVMIKNRKGVNFIYCYF